jgi:diguanylate cyclase (GGDEF)-like protein
VKGESDSGIITMDGNLDRAVVAVAQEVGRARSVPEAWALTAARLSALAGLPCGVRVHDGLDWRSVASVPGNVPHEAFGDAIRIPVVPFESAGYVRPAEILLGGGDQADAEGHAWSSAELQALTRDAVGEAVRLVALRVELDAARERARRLDTFSRALVSIADTSTLQRAILETMAQSVGAGIGALARPLPNEDGVLAVTATYGYPSVVVEDVRLAPGEGVLGRVFASGEPIVAVNTADIPGHVKRRRYRSTSYVALPITGPDGVLAVVALTDKADGSRFDHGDLAPLMSLAVPASLALGRELLRDRTTDLAHLATVDPLSSLFNRRFFENRLEEEIQRQRRQSHDLALLLLDLDNFKELNDTQGHLVGDRVIREMADILRRAVRIFDICARYGGEEFVILMPGASASTAVRIAERIRRQVEQHFAGALRIRAARPVTVSVGVSTALPTTTAETLIAHADSALFQAKGSGKNLVHLYSP